MPTVTVKKDFLLGLIGEDKYRDNVEFEKLCFEFGIESEVTNEKEILKKEQGENAVIPVGVTEEEIFRIDVPANRYDLLCAEGLAQGLRVFLNKQSVPTYKIAKVPNVQCFYIDESVRGIRPFAGAAILRNIKFTEESFKSFIDLQDKLHQNICRKRTFVAIGTHDLDTVEGPFYYEAVLPSHIKFAILNETREMTGDQVMNHLSKHAQLKQYLHIIEKFARYPVIKDSKGVVLSLPPIINGNHSRISVNTKNVFIECTGTDYLKLNTVLDTMVCMFSQYCDNPYEIEPIRVIYQDPNPINFLPNQTSDESMVKERLCPLLEHYSMNMMTEMSLQTLGVQLEVVKIQELLLKMGLKSKFNKDIITVTVPPTRTDILHECDIAEDLAIAYGYNSIIPRLPPTNTIGKQLPLNKLTDLLRCSLAEAGFTEGLTFTLCSLEDVSTKLGLDAKDVPAVKIENPKTLEFQVCRTTLLPGLLKTLTSNRHLALPMKIFEISDVVIKEPENEVGARNERRLCALYCNKNAGFEVIHGILDKVMRLFDVPWTEKNDANGYYLKPVDCPTYFPGRSAEIICHANCIGRIGVIHPSVLEKYDLLYPVSAVEICIEPFV